MEFVLPILKAAAYFLGLSVALGGLLLAIRRLLIHQWGIVQRWILARLRRKTSFAIARALVLRECGERLMARDDLRFLIVPGQDIQTPLPIDSAFIPLHFREEAFQTTSSDTLLRSEAHRLIIVGEPGSGKSSLLKRETFVGAQELRKRQKQATLPVFLKLSAIADAMRHGDAAESDPQILILAKAEACRHAPRELSDIWESLLEDGRVAFLLDGLDEVPLSDLDDVCTAIRKVCDALDARNSHNRVVLTARPQVIPLASSALQDAIPVQLTLERFRSADIYEFLTRWQFPRFQSRQLTPAAVFLTIAGNPHLKQLCQTPLLLAMYAALVSHSADAFDVPTTRADFYWRVVSELIVRRRRADLPPSRVRIQGWSRYVQEIAYIHLFESADGRNQVSRDTIDRAARRMEPELSSSPNFIADFIVNTGLLRSEREGETYYFMHLSLAEYLAANRLAKSEMSTAELAGLFLKERAPSANTTLALTPSTRAVLVFLSPQLRTHERRGLIDAVIHDVDEATLLGALVEAADYSAPAFSLLLKAVRADLRVSNDAQDRLGLLLTVSDLWQQIRPAVEAGDLAPEYDLSLDIRTVLGDADVAHQRQLITLIARADELTTWTTIRQLQIDITEYPEALLHLLSLPTVLSEFLRSAELCPTDRRTLSRLVLLEAALQSRQVGEYLAHEAGERGPEARRGARLSWLIGESWPRESLLRDLIDEAVLLVGAVPADIFAAKAARAMAQVRSTTRRVAYLRAVSPVVLVSVLCAISLLVAQSMSSRSVSVFLPAVVVTFQLLLFLSVGPRSSTLTAARRFFRHAVNLSSESETSAQSEANPKTAVGFLGRALSGRSGVKRTMRILDAQFPGLISFAVEMNRVPSFYRRYL